MRIKTDFPLSSEQISDTLKTELPLICKNKSFTYFTTDSREVREGDLFISLPSESLELSEKYAREAKGKGASILSEISDYADFKVRDAYIALLQIAKLYKKKLNSLRACIAITGSLGKTTAKEYTRRILGFKYKVHSTPENYNNFLGTAISILTAPYDTEVLVLEVGMNHAGEISMLSRTAEPDIALITNIGLCHIGNFGKREKIAEAKLEIKDGMKNDTVIAPFGEELLSECKYRFSISSDKADYFLDSSGNRHSFYVRGEKFFDFLRPIAAKQHRLALLEALSIAEMLGYSKNELLESVSMSDSVEFRQRTHKFKRFKVYDDSYSSSPEAVFANLEYLKSEYRDCQLACILGDMLELGEMSSELHFKVGVRAAELGYKKIFTFGELSKHIAEGALSRAPDTEIFENTDTENPKKTAELVLRHCKSGEIILLKASRKLRAERILKEIEAHEKENDR